MKIRDGFVSNSSTSSFMIMGVSYDRDEIMTTFNVEDSYDVCEKFDTLDVEFGYECDYAAIGLSPEKMKDDETLLDFKNRIVEELNKSELDVKVADLGWHEDAFGDY